MGLEHAGEAHALLDALPVFAELDDADLPDIACVFEEERYEPGETMFAEGDPGDRLLIVADGRAELCLGGAVGNVPLATLQRGDLVGRAIAPRARLTPAQCQPDRDHPAEAPRHVG
jgi:signal-transduction protein with cAMP-binding, CBS, and nucleotidyltransferase domain